VRLARLKSEAKKGAPMGPTSAMSIQLCSPNPCACYYLQGIRL